MTVTHRSLLANQRAVQEALGTRPGIRMGGWLPLHHDMGLVGQLLHALWLGGTAVLMSPAAFVKRPANWLEAISRYGLTVSGGPDFAYELCVRRINDSQLAALDLSRWEVAVNGGEPIDPATLTAFAERFAPAGLRPGALAPCYGLAEATLLVSGTRTAPPAAARTFDAAALEATAVRPRRPGPHPRALRPRRIRRAAHRRPGDRPRAARPPDRGDLGPRRERGARLLGPPRRDRGGLRLPYRGRWRRLPPHG